MTTKVTNIYNLKLTPSQFGQNSIVVNCSQYDSLFRVIQFNLFNGNAVYSIPEGSVVTIRGTKKDNTGFEYECDYSNNVVTFPLQQQITIFPGKVPAELRITNNGEIIGSWNFLFLVEESPLSDNTTISETQLPLLEQAIEAAGRLNEAFDDITEFTDETYPNAVQAIQDEGATQVANVTNEGTTQKGLVTSEGATQIANVQAEGTTQVANVQSKGNEVIASIPSEYEELSNQVEHAELYSSRPILVQTTASGWKLNDNKDGLCSSNESYKMVKYIVTEGTFVRVETDDKYQFQSVASVPSTGTSNRIGETYDASDTSIHIVPSGATYLIVSATVDSTPTAYTMSPKLADYREIMSSKNICGLETGIYYPVNIPQGTTLTFSTADGKILGGNNKVSMIFYDEDKNEIGSGGWTFGSGVATRTITHNFEQTVKYIRVIIGVEGREWQLEVGSSPTGYVPYAYNIKDYDVIRNLAGDPVISSNLIAQSFNSSYHEGATDFATKCTQFSSLMNGVDECESFLFFTDPHLLQSTGWEANCYEKIAQIQKYYNSTPTSFCLCGGDWLGNGDSVDSACFKLGYIDGFMHSMFKHAYLMVGNHDTNYQGAERLSENTINNLWYRKEGKAYYTIDGVNTKFYVFDTGIEAQALTAQDNYGMRQAEWFANALLSDNSSHIAVAMHILYNTISGMVIHPLTEQVLSIAEAYNGRTSITFNGNTYNYSSATGKVEFAIFGHTHDDYVFTIHGIPCIITTWVRASTTDSTFDLVLVDYTNRQINLVRVGDGIDRTVALI